METTPQNWNQYFLQHQTPMNIAINTQSEHPYNQFYGFPNLFYHPIIPQQMIYHPSSFIPPESTQLIEQLLLETIPDLDGTEGSFEMKKFFKKFDITLQDWSEKKKIFALKSKLYGKAKSFFILAIKSRHYNYKSIKNFILCQLLPSEYKVEESIDLVKKQTNSTQQKKNLKGHEKCHKQQNIPTPSFKNKVNIRFEKEEFPKEILEFFEKPIDQDSAKDESEFENFEKKGKLNNQFQKSSLNKINVPFENVSYPSEVLEFFGCPKEKEPSIVEKEIKLVDELQNSVPTDLHKKEIKKDIKEKNLLVEFEKEADFDLPINLFEEKAENKFKEESDISEKDLDIGLLEDSGNEQFCELDLELNFSLDGKQDFVSVEVLIPTEIHVFQEIVPLDIPVEIVSSESEKCFDLEKVGEASVELNEFGKEECDLKERGGDLCVDLKEFEKESEEYFDLKEMDDYCYGLEVEENDDKQESLGPKLEVFESDPEKEILPTRDKLKILEENENVKEKRKLLRSKLKEARILARLRCEVLMKENVRNDFGKDFEYGILKRKITGRFFLEVRRCLNFEKLVTMIRVPQLSKNFKKGINRITFDLNPKNVLYFVSVIKQDVICDSNGVEIEKDWKKRKRKEEKGLVESVSVTEFLTIGVHMETFHRRSGSLNRVGLENPMITLTLTSPKSKKEQSRHPKPFTKTDRTRRSYSDVEDAVI